MNELESYYNQSSNLGQTLGMIQRGEVSQRQGALAVQEAKDDITGALASEKEKTEEEGGGIGMGGGLLTKEGISAIGKRVVSKAKSTARNLIQSKVDELKQAKANAPKPEPEGSIYDKPELPQNHPTRNPQLEDTTQDAQGISKMEETNLGRFNNLDNTAKAQVRETLKSNTDFNADASIADDASRVKNVGIMNDALKDVEQNPATRFVSQMDGGADAVKTADVASPLTDTTAVLANPATADTAGGLNAFARSGLDVVNRATRVGARATNAVNEQLDNASKITAKSMQDLGNKIGIDFGDLTKEDVATGLSDVLKTTGDASKITEGLAGAGEIMEYFGPLGMLAGLGASIAGVFEAKKVNRDLINKSNDINTMTDNINTMGGMSFGSISNTAIDTSQFRSGGVTGNY